MWHRKDAQLLMANLPGLAHEFLAMDSGAVWGRAGFFLWISQRNKV
jgi:hypothetical protein